MVDFCSCFLCFAVVFRTRRFVFKSCLARRYYILSANHTGLLLQQLLSDEEQVTALVALLETAQDPEAHARLKNMQAQLHAVQSLAKAMHMLMLPIDQQELQDWDHLHPAIHSVGPNHDRDAASVWPTTTAEDEDAGAALIWSALGDDQKVTQLLELAQVMDEMQIASVNTGVNGTTRDGAEQGMNMNMNNATSLPVPMSMPGLAMPPAVPTFSQLVQTAVDVRSAVGGAGRRQ